MDTSHDPECLKTPVNLPSEQEMLAESHKEQEQQRKEIDFSQNNVADTVSLKTPATLSLEQEMLAQPHKEQEQQRKEIDFSEKNVADTVGLKMPTILPPEQKYLVQPHQDQVHQINAIKTGSVKAPYLQSDSDHVVSELLVQQQNLDLSILSDQQSTQMKVYNQGENLLSVLNEMSPIFVVNNVAPVDHEENLNGVQNRENSIDLVENVTTVDVLPNREKRIIESESDSRPKRIRMAPKKDVNESLPGTIYVDWKENGWWKASAIRVPLKLNDPTGIKYELRYDVHDDRTIEYAYLRDGCLFDPDGDKIDYSTTRPIDLNSSPNCPENETQSKENMTLSVTTPLPANPTDTYNVTATPTADNTPNKNNSSIRVDNNSNSTDYFNTSNSHITKDKAVSDSLSATTNNTNPTIRSADSTKKPSIAPSPNDLPHHLWIFWPDSGWWKAETLKRPRHKSDPQNRKGIKYRLTYRENDEEMVENVFLDGSTMLDFDEGQVIEYSTSQTKPNFIPQQPKRESIEASKSIKKKAAKRTVNPQATVQISDDSPTAKNVDLNSKIKKQHKEEDSNIRKEGAPLLVIDRREKYRKGNPFTFVKSTHPFKKANFDGLARSNNSGAGLSTSKGPPMPISNASINEIRLKARQLLSSALEDVPTDKGKKLARTIEDLTCRQYRGNTGIEYRSRMRQLTFNLNTKRNPGLCSAVLEGKFPPQQIVKMSSFDLANPIERQKLLERDSENFSRVVIKDPTSVGLVKAIERNDSTKEDDQQVNGDEDRIAAPHKNNNNAPEAINEDSEEKSEKVDTYSHKEQNLILKSPKLKNTFNQGSVLPSAGTDEDFASFAASMNKEPNQGSADDEKKNNTVALQGLKGDTALFLKEKKRGPKFWTGNIQNIETKPFKATSHFLCGEENSVSVLPENLEIMGRAALSETIDFVRTIQLQSSSRIVTLFYFNPTGPEEEKAYWELSEFLTNRNRAGVLLQQKELEAYLFPMGKESGKLHQKGFEKMIGAIIRRKGVQTEYRDIFNISLSRDSEEYNPEDCLIVDPIV